MAKHMVTCVECGRYFDAASHGYAYNRQSRRYTCRSCYQAMMRAEAQRNRINAQINKQYIRQINSQVNHRVKIGKEYKYGQPTWLFIIVLVLAAFNLYLSFCVVDTSSSDWVGEFLTAFFIFPAPFLCWAFIPFAYAKKRDKRKKEEKMREAEAERAYQLEQENELKLCSACGAKSRGFVCEYCGTELK